MWFAVVCFEASLKRNPANWIRGVFASTAPAYASEVLPLQLRIYLTTYTNM